MFIYLCRVYLFCYFETPNFTKCYQRPPPAIILNDDRQHLLVLRKSKVEVRPLPSVRQLARLSDCCQKLLLLSHQIHLSVHLLFMCLQDHGAAPAVEKGEVSTSSFLVHVWIQLFFFSFKIIIKIGLVMLFPPMLSTK